MRNLLIIFFVVLVLMYLLSMVSANECVNCHRYMNYTLEEKKFNEIRMRHISQGIPCSLECHAEKFKNIASSAYVQWSESKHGLTNVTCDKCHGGNPSAYYKDDAHKGIISPTEPESPLYYIKVPELCGKCHQKELHEFKSSKHYYLLETLHQAPSCTTCHPPHKFDVRKPEEFVKFCGVCHEENGVAPINIPYEAEKILEKIILLKESLNLLEKRAKLAKNEGYNVSDVLSYIEEAKYEVSLIPEKWHSFDMKGLKNSANIVEIKYNAAKEDLRNILYPKKKEERPQEVPAFTILIAITSILFIALRRLG